MYQVEDFVMYGTTGVCQIIDIKNESIYDGIQKEYYVLSPVYASNTIIKTPTDNQKIPIRKIITKDDVSYLINSMQNKDVAWIEDERQRNEMLKKMLKSNETDDLVTLIKSIYMCKEKHKEMGKKIYQYDEEIMYLAERLLNEEFSIVLNIAPEEVNQYILSNIPN